MLDDDERLFEFSSLMKSSAVEVEEVLIALTADTEVDAMGWSVLVKMDVVAAGFERFSEEFQRPRPDVVVDTVLVVVGFFEWSSSFFWIDLSFF